MPVSALFVSSRSSILFNLSAGAITDNSHSAMDVDPHFNSQFYAEDRYPSVSQLIIGLSLE